VIGRALLANPRLLVLDEPSDRPPAALAAAADVKRRHLGIA
jgi:ABC-type branched-subunit amino acid transport system ATPase component